MIIILHWWYFIILLFVIPIVWSYLRKPINTDYAFDIAPLFVYVICWILAIGILIGKLLF